MRNGRASSLCLSLLSHRLALAFLLRGSLPVPKPLAVASALLVHVGCC